MVFLYIAFDSLNLIDVIFNSADAHRNPIDHRFGLLADDGCRGIVYGDGVADMVLHTFGAEVPFAAIAAEGRPLCAPAPQLLLFNFPGFLELL